MKKCYHKECNLIYDDESKYCSKDGSLLFPEILKDRYKIIKKLDKGGMGNIFLGEDIKLEREVVIKFLLPEYTKNEEVLKRFEAEAKAAAKINSPHVVQVFDFDSIDEIFFIVMEFLNGQDLKSILEREKILPYYMIIEIFKQLAEVLDIAHSKGIIHRDLKPSNIVLIPSHDSITVKIIDFGIAKIKSSVKIEQDITLTSTGFVLGTPTYMAPEQGINSKSIDHTADIYSLGVILYECITGKPAFESLSKKDENQIIRFQSPEPSKVRPDITPRLEKVIMKAMADEPAQRYQSCKELFDSLSIAIKEISLSNNEQQQIELKKKEQYLETIKQSQEITIQTNRSKKRFDKQEEHSLEINSDSFMTRRDRRKNLFKYIGLSAILITVIIISSFFIFYEFKYDSEDYQNIYINKTKADENQHLKLIKKVFNKTKESPESAADLPDLQIIPPYPEIQTNSFDALINSNVLISYFNGLIIESKEGNYNKIHGILSSDPRILINNKGRFSYGIVYQIPANLDKIGFTKDFIFFEENGKSYPKFILSNKMLEIFLKNKNDLNKIDGFLFNEQISDYIASAINELPADTKERMIYCFGNSVDIPDSWNWIKKISLMYRHDINDLAVLSNLKNIEELYLYKTNITSLEPIKNIKLLSIGDTKINSLQGIPDSINYLYLNNLKIDSFMELSELKNLKILNLTKTNIQETDLQSLKLPQLEELHLNYTNIKTLDFLTAYKNLTILSLTGTKISDISNISYLKNLEILRLDQTKTNDILPLYSLNNLRYVDLNKTKVNPRRCNKLANSLKTNSILVRCR